jgi:hypothetical protein
MHLIIEIDESILSEAAASMFVEQFSYQRFGKAFGTELLQKQVHTYVRQMDFTPYIQAAAQAKLDDVVNKVVEHALREAAKKKAAQMQADGRLIT